jgi:ferritin-like metal-binding protein YciE
MEPGKKRNKTVSGSRGRSSKDSSRSRGRASADEQSPISVKERLALYLKYLLSMENASLDRLQSRINETSLQALKSQFQQHLGETRKQRDRLKQLVIDFGGRPTQDKAQLSVPFMTKSLNDPLRENELYADYELMGTREDAILENVEIINYHFALLLVRNAGLVDAIRPLSQNMTEEISMAEWIISNIPNISMKSQPEVTDSAVKQA